MDAVGARAFEQKIENAVGAARRVLDVARSPAPPSDVPHSYSDKYALAGGLVALSVASWINLLEMWGLNPKSLRTLRQWAVDRSVTLRFTAEERCEFDREETRDVEAPTKHVREGFGAKIVDKVVTKVHDYFWKFECVYQLCAFVGTDSEDALVLQGRTCKYEHMTNSKDVPRPKVVKRDPLDVNLTWGLGQLAVDTLEVVFTIDRSSSRCRTPRRNVEVEQAVVFFEHMERWAHKVHRYFSETLFPFETGHALDLRSINDDSVFIPVVPLFVATPAKDNDRNAGAGSQALVSIRAPESPLMLTLGEMNQMLAEQKRSISEKFSDLAKVFPDPGKLIGCAEANLMVGLLHSERVTHYLVAGLDYIEDMLRQQVVAAIGKEVQPTDFAKYMLYHNQRIFREEYRPQAFAYAIRRPGHSPEGILSLEASPADGSIVEPMQTLVSKSELEKPMEFVIGAGTRIRYTGQMHLHGLLLHQFADETGVSVRLNARARQFCSFLVLVGRITGPEQFDPQFGMVVQNKDDLTIPLDLETIPSAGEFKAATISISPEQQAFAKMYRSMQLSSTLFGVCVIQIKPALERVLNLEEDSLTKEIALTQELMEMFIKFQIPSDLLSFGGSDSATKEERIESVKRNMKSVRITIELAKNKELLDALDEAEKRALDAIAAAQPVKSPRKAAISQALSPRKYFEKDKEKKFKEKKVERKRSAKISDAKGKLSAAPSSDSNTPMMEAGPSGGDDYAMEPAPVVSANEDDVLDSRIADASPPPPPPPAEAAMPMPPPPAGAPPPPPISLDADISSKSLSVREERSREKEEEAPRRARSAKKKEMAKRDYDESYLSSKISASSSRSAPAPRPKPIDPREQIRREYTMKRDALVKARKQLVEEQLALDRAKAESKAESSLSSSSAATLVHSMGGAGGSELASNRDVTQIPAAMDAQLEKLDPDGALRPVIINVGKSWQKMQQPKLLAPLEQKTLSVTEQKLEQQTCYDLLDALTKSGSDSYALTGASMHVVIASNHCFEKSVLNTLVRDNVNPIAKVEHSQLIIASNIFGKKPEELLEDSGLMRIKQQSPNLFLEE